MIRLALEIALGLGGYCVCMWLLVFLTISRSHRRYRRKHGEDYYGGCGELGLVILAPVLPLLMLHRLLSR